MEQKKGAHTPQRSPAPPTPKRSLLQTTSTGWMQTASLSEKRQARIAYLWDLRGDAALRLATHTSRSELYLRRMADDIYIQDMRARWTSFFNCFSLASQDYISLQRTEGGLHQLRDERMDRSNEARFSWQDRYTQLVWLFHRLKPDILQRVQDIRTPSVRHVRSSRERGLSNVDNTFERWLRISNDCAQLK